MGHRVLSMIVALFVGVYVARYLGPERFGLLSYAGSFVGLFTALATLGLDGIMVRERPATVFLLGMFYAESLILAETANSVGAIQIAGTDASSQLPFFIAACDYTLIGEELYAASAYMSREPLLLGISEKC